MSVLAASERDVWSPDPDPFVAALERGMTALGTSYLYHVHRDLHRVLKLPPLPASYIRELYHVDTLAKASQAEARRKALERARETYERVLAGRSPGEAVPPEVYRDLVQAITDEWYGRGRLETRAQQRAVASYITGLLQAGYMTQANPKALLERYAGVLGERHAMRIEFARARAAEHIRHLDENTRHAIVQVIYAWEEDRRQPMDLARALADQFGRLNRDWRRVALTEVARNRAAGYLAGLPDGAVVEWSAARDACDKCRKLHGRRFTVVPGPGDPKLDVWPGKNPIGRRDPVEHAAIPLHPHCRCRWIHVSRAGEGVNPEFERKLQGLIALATR